jgi:WD40 repeat protein
MGSAYISSRPNMKVSKLSFFISGGCKIALTHTEEYMISGGEDGCLRFWNISNEKRPCVYVVDRSHVGTKL